MSQAQKGVAGPELQRFNGIVNARIGVSVIGDAGQKVSAKIQSANYDYYDEKNGWSKQIYNFNLRKDDYFKTIRFDEGYAAAIALENSGDSVGAKAIFDKMLNESQLSFSIINASGKAAQFPVGDTVALMLTTAEVADKETGELRTVIVVDSMSGIALKHKTKSALLGAQVETVLAPAPAAEIAAVVTPAMS